MRHERLRGPSEGGWDVMSTAQSGIFALGTPSHAYLEFDLQSGKDAGALIKAMADVREPRTTIGGVNFVSGFRPELWRSVVPEGLPGDLTGFNQNLTGPVVRGATEGPVNSPEGRDQVDRRRRRHQVLDGHGHLQV